MNIKSLIAQLTLEEKAGLCSGSDFWFTKAVERLNIPAVMVSDGPHGLRKQQLEGDHLGINDSIKAVCYPTGSALASSFDRELFYHVGENLGETCQAENVSVLLGPAVNIKRSPLCGRNFEYLSEDPYLSGELAAAQINGVQSKGVGTSIKHFLANSQEKRRMSASSEVDDRTLREIYLPAFEIAVKKSQPWTVMCSYNRINGVYASENKRYLTDILRDEWDFQGLVVSDWGAVNDRPAGLEAGLDLEMPASSGINDKLIVSAVQTGNLQMTVLDQAVERILKLVFRYTQNRDFSATFDLDAQHEQSRNAAAQSIVLLKNDDQILPLRAGQKIAFIGEFAAKPRYQGGGSSHINSHKVTSALAAARDNADISYAQGFHIESELEDSALVEQAVKLAASSDIAVVFAGLPDSFESEGYDRNHMRMPVNQNALIEAVAAVQTNTVVVLHNGSPVEMPWINQIKGLIEAYLSGQAVGAAVLDILYGAVNPSGKLAETFPLKLEDNPSFLFYGGEKDRVEYREGIFVGYRYYDKKKMDVLFPFGHGLSYTNFELSGIKISDSVIKDTETVEVTVAVKNTGAVKGREVVQLYVADLNSQVIRPVRELKGFAKIELEPGEDRTIAFELDKRSFAFYDVELQEWRVESGLFEIQLGNSSRNISQVAQIEVISTTSVRETYTLNSTIGDLAATPEGRIRFAPIVKRVTDILSGGEKEQTEIKDDAASAAITQEMVEAMLNDLPLRAIVSFGDGSIDHHDLIKMLEQPE